MANFGKVNLDFTLFLRPFTYNSWAVIGATTLVCIVVALFYQTSPMEKYQEETSGRITMFIVWTFFLLLNAFYGGALTMFFTSKPALPFTTLRQGLGNEDWKMIMIDGEQMLVQQFTEGDNADPLFKNWWDTVHATEDSKDSYFYPSNKAAVLQLLEPRHFLYGNENGAAAELPMHGFDIDLQVMGRTKKQTHTGVILLPRASPLRKFFDKSR